MSWLDIAKRKSVQEAPKEEPKPVVKIERPKIEKPKDETEQLRRRIRELERVIEQQNQQFQQMHRELSEKNELIRELEHRETEISNADKRNLQFLVNCVAKTYQNEFRKQRAPAVKLALENIIERFDLHTPDEMENE